MVRSAISRGWRRELGCIGFLTANGEPCHGTAGVGGRRSWRQDNPWSISAPAGRYPPLMLDIRQHRGRAGEGFPRAAAEGALPSPITGPSTQKAAHTIDPVAALASVILPMAEYKGYAISLMMDVLSGVLSGQRRADGGECHLPRRTSTHAAAATSSSRSTSRASARARCLRSADGAHDPI